MRHFLLLLITAFPFLLHAQITCEVVPADTLICYRDSIAFETRITGTGPFTYEWQKNSVPLPGATDSILIFSRAIESDTGVYRCKVKNAFDSVISNDARLRMHPAMRIDTLYRYNDLGCRTDCKGQFKALVSGGTPPYSYQWGGGYSQDTIVFGLCMGSYTLKVYDHVGCMIDSNYYVDVLRSPGISFISFQTSYLAPQDTFFLTNPTVYVEFPDEYRDSLINWEWDFADGMTVSDINPAGHVYAKTGEFAILLTIKDLNGCDTTVAHFISVKVVDLWIPSAFTPNGDGFNDKFMIQVKGDPEYDFRNAYLGNELIIYDRWGKKVYDKTNYESGEWDGANLPDGAYFYILKCIGQYEDEVYRGAVHILGRGQ